ncbi:MAG: hypothetical protein JNM72_09485 [Deltaproteobacteria bacterium]|nr:hypothetical protein [Deltaproteobacteria bacterium]
MSAAPAAQAGLPARTLLGLTGAVSLALLLLGLAELAWGPSTRIGFEEGQNARAGLLVACGHLDALWALQYRPFCGGCSVDALLAAPLLRLIGPTEGVFKLVPLAWTALGGGLSAALAAALCGRRAALLCLGLLLGAPAVAVELAMTGWGNHAEGLALPLAGLLVLIGPATAPGLMRGAASGALISLGAFYTASTAWAAPVALALAAAAGPRALIGLLAALPLGLLPWAWSQPPDPRAWEVARDRWAQLQLAPPAALWRWLVAEALRPGVLWPSIGPRADGLAVAAAAAAGALGLGGAAALLRGVGPARWARARAAAPALGLLALVCAYALRHDLWAPEPELAGYAPFSWRYRAALLPLVAWAGAAAAGRLQGPRAWAAAAVVALIGAHGLLRRAGAWSGGIAPGLQRPLVDLVGPDPSLPAGQPPVRRAVDQGRQVDLEAGAAALAAHRDPLPACRVVHALELSRRIGLGPLDRPGASTAFDALDVVIDELPEAQREPARAHLARPAAAQRPAGAPPPAWAAALRAPHPAEDAGRAAAAALTAEGAARPDPAALAAQLQGLSPAGAAGLGAGLGAALGCGAAAGLPPLPAGDPATEALRSGLAVGCAPWRWGAP